MRKDDIEVGKVYAAWRGERHVWPMKVEVVEVGVSHPMSSRGPKNSSRVRVLGRTIYNGKFESYDEPAEKVIANREIRMFWSDFEVKDAKRKEDQRVAQERRDATKARVEGVVTRLRHEGVEARISSYPSVTIVIRNDQCMAMDDLLDRAAGIE